MKKRTLVIGDIHGGLSALKQVLDRANRTSDDTLIFLGDYVDGWSQSFQVIQHLIELNKQNHCIFIKGNHDAWCEDWLSTGKMENTWLVHGGDLTVKSYHQANKQLLNEHLAFLIHTGEIRGRVPDV
ncbi:MAG TPA: metallophosphoesterase [Bacteroidia bacterium]|nr:metallophosphoesterase [Bacteroidia bacterium]